MKLKIEITTDSAAFEDFAGVELSRILKRLADDLEDWPGENVFTIKLRDINGNTVGRCSSTE